MLCNTTFSLVANSLVARSISRIAHLGKEMRAAVCMWDGQLVLAILAQSLEVYFLLKLIEPVH
jgi:hypothetical protein